MSYGWDELACPNCLIRLGDAAEGEYCRKCGTKGDSFGSYDTDRENTPERMRNHILRDYHAWLSAKYKARGVGP